VGFSKPLFRHTLAKLSVSVGSVLRGTATPIPYVVQDAAIDPGTVRTYRAPVTGEGLNRLIVAGVLSDKTQLLRCQGLARERLGGKTGLVNSKTYEGSNSKT
jgi:hypothetical protein